MKKRQGATLNPFSGIEPEGRFTLDDCQELAKALVVRTGKEQDQHWNDTAEAINAAIFTFIARYGDQSDGMRDLLMAREIISKPGRFQQAIQVMLETTDWGGLLSQCGGHLQSLQDRELHSAISSTLRGYVELGTPAIAEFLKETNFDLPAIRQRPMTIYVAMPVNRAEGKPGFLRVIVTTLMRECMRGGLGENRAVYVILEEAAILGNLDCIKRAVTVGRSFGLKLILIYQSLGQITKCFPDGDDITLLGNTNQVFFGTNDSPTAEAVSKRLGQQTVVVSSGGSSRGTSHGTTYGQGRSHNLGGSEGTNDGWGQQARSLLTPDEISALDRRVALTFVPGMRPIMTRLVRYYEENLNPGWLRIQWVGFRKLVFWGLALAFALFIAVQLTQVIKPKPVRYGPSFHRVR